MPLPNVNSNILEMIIRYVTYHTNARATHACEDDVKAWDSNFLEIEDDVLYKLIKAANYMEVCDLVDVALDVIVKEMERMTPEEIRARYNLKDDLTAEEKQQILSENTWSNVD